MNANQPASNSLQHFESQVHAVRALLVQADYATTAERCEALFVQVEQLPVGDQPAARAELFELRGQLHQFQYQYDAAMADFEAMREAAPSPARVLEAEALICHIMILRGQYDDAVKKLGEVETKAREVSASRAQALAWRGMGNVAWRRGDTDEALRYLSRALEMFRKMDDIDSQMRVLRIMGHARFHRGEYDRAIKHHQECLNLALALKNKRLAAMELNNLGECYQSMYDMKRALDHHTRSLRMREELGIDPGPDVIRNLGVALVALELYDEGMIRLQDALRRARTQGNADFIMQALNSLGKAYLAMKQHAEALSVGQDLFKMAEEVGSANVHRAEALLILGRASLAQGQLQEAHGHLQKGLFAAQASRSSGALLWELHAALGEASPSPMLAEVHFRIASDLIMQTAAAIEEDGGLRSSFLNNPHIQDILNRSRSAG